MVTHPGCPAIEEGRGVAGWDLLDLVDVPGVLVTLSGQGMFCEYPHTELDAFVRRVIEVFSPRRVMWGSNYPVVGDTDAYVRDLDLVLSGRWGLTEEDIARMSEANAGETFFSTDWPRR